MNSRESPLYWSFPIGTWFGTGVRVSIFFPLLLLLFCYQFEPLPGAVLTAVVFVTVVLHEFGHVTAARRTGGSADSILIWPLGGLAFVQPQRTFTSRFVTAAAGPAVNLLLCSITLWHILNVDPLVRNAAFNPVVMPPGLHFTADPLSDLLVLVFTVNWTLLLVNLIPVYPLDGGQMLQAALSTRFGHETATDAYIKVGFLFAFVMMIGGLLLNETFVLFIGAIVLVLNFQESVQLRSGDSYDESFMGYDFSQGYTSLERSHEEPAPQRRPGWWVRRQEKRRLERQRREEAKAAEDAALLDALLEKVHTQGMQALSDAERRQLTRVSERLRDKGTRRS